MDDLTTTTLLGLALGLRHALDADHVVAVATIASRERRVTAAAAIGAFWGLGHSVIVLLAGLAVLWLGVVVPERVGLAAELGVAAMLVGLGVWSLLGLRARHRHGPHRHGDLVHTHPPGDAGAGHGHPLGADAVSRVDAALGHARLYRRLRPVVIGALHGLAGSAALALLLVPMVTRPLVGVGYLLAFCGGTVVGMVAATLVIALPATLGGGRWPRLPEAVRAVAGVASIGVGVLLARSVLLG
ncbi:MAG: high-affinity nickel-transport family protein [Myxococcales bacterium]|nr:high-affinity nickel-transport family protein [Myxococcales bacterium]